MRVRHRVLVDADDRPAGGRWNFDASNRNAWRGEPPEPPDSRVQHDHGELWKEIVHAGVKSFGEPHASALRWPVHRGEALRRLDGLIEHGLPSFGRLAAKTWPEGQTPESFSGQTQLANNPHPFSVKQHIHAWRMDADILPRERNCRAVSVLDFERDVGDSRHGRKYSHSVRADEARVAKQTRSFDGDHAAHALLRF
jgi:hypothetical protein